MLQELNAWGLLPLGLGLVWFVSGRLARLVFPQPDFGLRTAGAIVLAMGVVQVSVGSLATFGVLSAGPLLALLSVVALVLGVVTRALPAARWPVVERASVPVLAALALVALAAIVTARILPIWQWDSVGYHLPFVQFVVQAHGFSGVPADVRYISTYPHDVELEMIFLRTLLPDDRLVDLAQIPYGLASAALIALLARRLGAAQPLSLLAGAAWLCAPGVFLQLPTNYVDVATATALLAAVYWLLLTPLSARALVLGGLALGLFLGSKPSAPVATAFLGALTVLRAARARHWVALGAFCLAVLLFGGEMYAVMLVRHGNPVWPVQVHLGPWILPGESSVDELLSSGAAHRPNVGSLPARVLTSWLAVDTSPVFDMHTGGFGLLFLLAFPLAVMGVVRRRAGWVVPALLACLLSPDPSATRYVLAFAALIFALAAAELSRSARLRPALVGLVLALGLGQVARAWPGLTDGGPPWSAFWAMSDEERREALGPDGSPEQFSTLWGLVGRGESAAFDTQFELPAYVWAPELSYPVKVVPEGADFQSWLERSRVRLLAIGPAHQRIIDAQPQRWEKLFDCNSEPCAVYLRR